MFKDLFVPKSGWPLTDVYPLTRQVESIGGSFKLPTGFELVATLEPLAMLTVADNNVLADELKIPRVSKDGVIPMEVDDTTNDTDPDARNQRFVQQFNRERTQNEEAQIRKEAMALVQVDGEMRDARVALIVAVKGMADCKERTDMGEVIRKFIDTRMRQLERTIAAPAAAAAAAAPVSQWSKCVFKTRNTSSACSPMLSETRLIWATTNVESTDFLTRLLFTGLERKDKPKPKRGGEDDTLYDLSGLASETDRDTELLAISLLQRSFAGQDADYWYNSVSRVLADKRFRWAINAVSKQGYIPTRPPEPPRSLYTNPKESIMDSFLQHIFADYGNTVTLSLSESGQPEQGSSDTMYKHVKSTRTRNPHYERRYLRNVGDRWTQVTEQAFGSSEFQMIPSAPSADGSEESESSARRQRMQ
jgi:hypothetical protein